MGSQNGFDSHSQMAGAHGRASEEFKEYVERRLATLEEGGMKSLSKGISRPLGTNRTELRPKHLPWPFCEESRSPSSVLLPFFWEGSPTKIDYSKQGTLIQASL